MAENPNNQPREGDAVLGGQIPPPADGAVLGGLAGAKRRFASDTESYRIAALREAAKYGAEGLDLAIQALKDPAVPIRLTAYHLIRQAREPKAKQVFEACSPCEFFQCLHTISGHSRAVVCVALSADGKTLISASRDTTIKVWDLEKGQVVRTFKMNLIPQSESVYRVTIALSPDGQTLCGCSDQSFTIEVWDVRTGRKIYALERDSQRSSDQTRWLAISPDGQTLFSSGSEARIQVWDLQNGQKIDTFTHPEEITALAVSPDGKTLTIGSKGKIILWNWEKGEEIAILYGHARLFYLLELGTFLEKESWVNKLLFSPDGKILVSRADDESVKVWDVKKGLEINSLAGDISGVRNWCISPDSKTLVTGSDRKIIKVWDLQTGEEIRAIAGHPVGIEAIALSPDGNTVICGGEDSTIRVWDLQQGKQIRTLSGAVDCVLALAISPDGKTLVSGTYGATLKVWDLPAKQEIYILSGHPACVRPIEPRSKHSDAIKSVAISPDGHAIASGSKDKIIKIWDLPTGRAICTLTGHSSDVNSLAFTPDGQRLVSGGEDIKIWDIQTGQVIRTFQGHSRAVNCFAIAPDGKILVSGSGDKIVKIWDLQTGREIRTLSGHSGGICAIALHPNGEAIASSSEDKTVKIWELQTGRLIRTLSGHSHHVRAVTFSPDGRAIASGSSDTTVKLWDWQAGREIATHQAHAEVYSAAFAPDGKTLVTGSFEDIKVWGVPEE